MSEKIEKLKEIINGVLTTDSELEMELLTVKGEILIESLSPEEKKSAEVKELLVYLCACIRESTRRNSLRKEVN